MAPPPAPTTLAADRSGPQPPPLRAAVPGTVQPLGVAATSAQIGVALGMATTVYTAWASWHRRSLLVSVRDGDSVLTPERADDVDRLVRIGGLLSLATLVIGAVFFIRWFHRAYRNLSSVMHVERKVGWAIGGWFVPFLNIVRPFQIAKELATRSPDPPLFDHPRVVKVWWMLLFGSTLITRIVVTSHPTTIDGAINQDIWSAVSDLLYIGAGFAAIALIRSVTAAQQRRFGF